MVESTSRSDLVLDYELDEIRYRGEVLPVSLSQAQAKAITEHGQTVLTLTLVADQLTTVPAAPELVSFDKPTPPPTAEQMFDRQMQQARQRQAAAGR